MADFQQAVKWMNQGKKVRRIFWEKDARYYKLLIFGVDETIKGINKNNKEYQAYFGIDDFEAIDWEIYKEEKSLSDKAWSGICFTEKDKEYYLEDDVKESIKRLKDKLPIVHRRGVKDIMIHEEINEIFGDRLL